MLRAILILILLIIAARIFWRVVDAVIAGASGAPGQKQVRPGVKLVRDPVCGTYVAPGTALALTSGDTTHYFCSEKCRAEFKGR